MPDYPLGDNNPQLIGVGTLAGIYPVFKGKPLIDGLEKQVPLNLFANFIVDNGTFNVAWTRDVTDTIFTLRQRATFSGSWVNVLTGLTELHPENKSGWVHYTPSPLAVAGSEYHFQLVGNLGAVSAEIVVRPVGWVSNPSEPSRRVGQYQVSSTRSPYSTAMDDQWAQYADNRLDVAGNP